MYCARAVENNFSLGQIKKFSKTCLKRPLKKNTKNGFQYLISLNEGEHSAIVLTCIILPNDFKPFVLSIFEWPLKAGFTVSVFRVMGLKILCKVGTHIFFIIFFSGNKYIFLHFERQNYIFPRKPKKNLRFH